MLSLADKVLAASCLHFDAPPHGVLQRLVHNRGLLIARTVQAGALEEPFNRRELFPAGPGERPLCAAHRKDLPKTGATLKV
jgi:hypothetical protein